ncbi:MAG: hypothetical protein IJ767_00565 [Bacteroidaceae bacterium]|nr:hypothetical protein [Bacteroidaceae bacterium]
MTTARYKVAEHLLEVRLPDTMTPRDIIPSFSPFVSEEEGDVLFTMEVSVGTAPDFSAWEEIGQFDCGGANHGVYRQPDGSYAFEISLPDCDGGALSCCMTARDDFRRCEAVLTGDALRQHQFGLNNALMMAFAFAAAEQDTLLVHASVIRHDGRGYLFTAPSGTGKSTHTWLWHKYIPGCDLMNDDNPVVRVVEGEARIYGSPWSGKTPCYRNIWAPIGAITRIEQKPENTIRRMAVVEAFATLLPAVSSMKWDRRVYNGICQAIGHLLPTTPVFWLGCRPDEEAVRVCFAAVKVES